MRAVFAQRELTSFTDPYAGWTNIDGKDFVVRERSAYKASFDLQELKTYQQFAEYVECGAGVQMLVLGDAAAATRERRRRYIAVATATSHVRGTVGKSPAARLTNHLVKPRLRNRHSTGCSVHLEGSMTFGYCAGRRPRSRRSSTRSSLTRTRWRLGASLSARQRRNPPRRRRDVVGNRPRPDDGLRHPGRPRRRLLPRTGAPGLGLLSRHGQPDGRTMSTGAVRRGPKQGPSRLSIYPVVRQKDAT